MKEPLLDTDIISYYLRNNANVSREMKLAYEQYGYLSMSVVSYYEVINGLLFKDAKGQLKSFEQLIQSFQIIPLDTAIANIAAQIFADLRRNNQIVAHTDVLIGATALHYQMKLVTNNQAHFSRIPNLELDNWV
ncbi:MAG: type II toxin-antitoxin system VapC family toxin [Saprospiraceae bacterium]|nr:type II toxin-antitoxin system VapC family toxin [Saprospiraceae bacterium]